MEQESAIHLLNSMPTNPNPAFPRGSTRLSLAHQPLYLVAAFTHISFDEDTQAPDLKLSCTHKKKFNYTEYTRSVNHFGNDTKLTLSF